MWSGLAEIEFDEDEGKESGTELLSKTLLRENVGMVKNVPVDYMSGLKSCVGYGLSMLEEGSEDV